MPELFGESADLLVQIIQTGDLSRLYLIKKAGNYCFYGVREFGMAQL